ncbi:MAG: ATP-dependent metallopeptidase FtsH/Yme1/Tma family protein [Campylobacter sputorum]|uniref:AAA family ATPase n=2 Tax=Campylobacter sputorum TaxID=206 RepID=UPI001E43FF27|nr:ATP-dependent metallopeptidase FtsH/Yme1/Tma family protein [Campylobacter sputorum]MDY6119865.1 ATP-dependent metallopeptidase FtsH/Yme1/Tma family protein [Campylobacter sputorum]
MISKMKQIIANFKFTKIKIVVILAFILAILFGIVVFRNSPKTISLNAFDALVEQNVVSKAYIKDDFLIVIVNNQAYQVLSSGVDFNKTLRKIPIDQVKSSEFLDIFLSIVVFFMLCITIFFVVRKYKQKTSQTAVLQKNEDIENIINSSLTPVISNVKFEDVAGIDEIKNELSEIVDFLKNPSRYRHFGINLPKGVLMVGPPGVGKTLIAKAVAGEANVPFFYQSGSSFVQIYVGMGAKRVRELFAKAKSYAPSIIFIDEIDAVGKARGGGRNDEREATLNQLLTEMDGFEDSSGVIVIAATNKIEMMDDALLRSGRFDRRIFIPMPDIQSRAAILKTYLKNKQSEVDIMGIAKSTVGFSGAGIATLVNEAAIHAIRIGSGLITNDDFEAVQKSVLYGKRKTITYSDEEKEILSIYQAAKAICAFWLDFKFEKISMLEDKFINIENSIESKKHLLGKIKVYLAGMAALKIYRNDLYSNSKNDLEEAKQIAHKIAYEYGMSQSIFPNQIEVENIINEAFNEISEYLMGVKEQLLSVGAYIYKNESIEYAALKEILGQTYK